MVEEQQVRNAANIILCELGPGFTERIYHNAIETYLRKIGTPFRSEHEIPVKFMGEIVGNVRADLIINDAIVVELKTTNSISDNHSAQCKMYMKLMNIKNGLVINFPRSEGEDLYIEKVSLDNVKLCACYRCGREGHYASDCYAKKHVNGYYIH